MEKRYTPGEGQSFQSFTDAYVAVDNGVGMQRRLRRNRREYTEIQTIGISGPTIGERFQCTKHSHVAS
jgi:hypothetical protein